ncbi:hypothetical protein QQZ08_007977 [Neonectria magnoliae]|uniref:Uncharacterized protein n=1 Tax=Neonectria magnoliae TaxID=2732573 RepID=A0ABR1HY49_9HYPO
MIRISDVCTRPVVRFFTNPWDLVLSGRMVFLEGSMLRAVIKGEDVPVSDTKARKSPTAANGTSQRQRTPDASYPHHYEGPQSAPFAPQYVYQNGVFVYHPQYSGMITQPYWLPDTGPGIIGNPVESQSLGPGSYGPM